MTEVQLILTKRRVLTMEMKNAVEYCKNGVEVEPFAYALSLVEGKWKLTIVYRNAANVRHVLTQPDFPQNVYVDNDFGVLFPLQEYISAGMPMEE